MQPACLGATQQPGSYVQLEHMQQGGTDGSCRQTDAKKQNFKRLLKLFVILPQGHLSKHHVCYQFLLL